MEHSIGNPFFWTLFILVVLILLAIDLGAFHRHAHSVNFREAAIWSFVWIALSLLFGHWIYVHFGKQAGLEFFAGYLIEKALSIDNIFVFILIFSYFSVPAKLHHRVLFWGILGALVMRGLFILAGAALIQAFHWTIYIFGVFLVFTGIKILRKGETEVEPQRNPIVKLFRKLIPMSTGYETDGFFHRHQGKLVATPLTLALVTVEATDLIFAVDSIPAVFGVTHDPFIVYTSNVCAILGLRALYFLLAAFMKKFVYLGAGLGIVLVFIGVKMLLSGFFSISIGLSLATIAVILTGSIILSLVFPQKKA